MHSLYPQHYLCILAAFANLLRGTTRLSSRNKIRYVYNQIYESSLQFKD